MIKIVSIQQMRSMDRQTIDQLGVPGIVLMENAGRHTFDYIKQFLSDNGLYGRIDVYCGKGNNGGDGYVIARHLFNYGYNTRILSIGDPQKLTGDAKTNYTVCANYKIPVTVINSVAQIEEENSPALIVDALLGTGIKGEVRGLLKEIIMHINQINVPVVSVDIPSGLNGDSSGIAGETIKADLTVTMALPKLAHLFYPAKEFVGELEIADISIPASVKNSEDITINLVEYSDLVFPQIRADAHKYSAGKLFIIAGSTGMTGAASLTASAALRMGVGLVNIGIPKSINTIMEIKITEGLTVPLPETADGTISMDALSQIKAKIDWADAVVLGPGCGRNIETLQVLRESVKYCQSSETPTLVDADGLFALSEDTQLTINLTPNFILTPHFGEFQRLTSFTKEEILSEPWQKLKSFISDKAFSLNLKGAPSMVGISDGELFVNSTGNVSLAKGGSGDILAGIIGGLLARGIGPAEAAITGNYIHGEAADRLIAEFGVDSLLPSDLLKILPDILSFDW